MANIRIWNKRDIFADSVRQLIFEVFQLPALVIAEALCCSTSEALELGKVEVQLLMPGLLPRN